MISNDLNAVSAWASSALSRIEGRQRRVLSCTPIIGGASPRHYYRVQEGPQSWLVMVVRERVGEYLAVPDAYRAELDYVGIGKFLHRSGIVVPDILHVGSDCDWLLIEDFGDITLEQASVHADPSRRMALYTSAMQTLVQFAALTSRTRMDAIAAAQRVLDRDTLVWEMQHFVEWWMDAEDRAPNAADRAIMDHAFGRLAAEILESGTVLVHRDYHSRNLMVLPNGIGVIDFQDALLGSPTYDLASLLLDCYVESDLKAVPLTVNAFRNMLVAAGLSSISGPDFRRQFVVQGLQRIMKAAGRHKFLSVRSAREDDRAAARRGVATLGRLLQCYDDFAPLRNVMARYVPALTEI